MLTAVQRLFSMFPTGAAGVALILLRVSVALTLFTQVMPQGNPAAHLWTSAGVGLLGGAIWGIGTVFNLVAANFTGVAISYAIGQSAPMVAALWGVLAWKEFRGAKRQAYVYLALMFVFYFLSILVISYANTAN